MNKETKGKLTEALYNKILADLVKENEYYSKEYGEEYNFSIEELEKVAAKRTIQQIETNVSLSQRRKTNDV